MKKHRMDTFLDAVDIVCSECPFATPSVCETCPVRQCVETITESNATPAAPPPLCVCWRCLMGIESREGKQITREIYLDEDDPRPCDWCEDDTSDVLYEIL